MFYVAENCYQGCLVIFTFSLHHVEFLCDPWWPHQHPHSEDFHGQILGTLVTKLQSLDSWPATQKLVHCTLEWVEPFHKKILSSAPAYLSSQLNTASSSLPSTSLLAPSPELTHWWVCSAPSSIHSPFCVVYNNSDNDRRWQCLMFISCPTVSLLLWKGTWI